MAGWDCFALPTLSEGFSLSVLEAMASRLPVVVSDLPALREAVVPGKGGFWFCLAACLTGLLPCSMCSKIRLRPGPWGHLTGRG